MSIKVPMNVWKILGVAFTSILAPVGIRHLDDQQKQACPAEVPVATQTAQYEELPPSETRIRAKGSGSTSEAAFQSAIDAALRQAVAAEVSAADWNLHSQAYLSTLRQNGTGVLRGWQEISTSNEWHVTGRTHHSEVTVEVDIEALRESLKSVAVVQRR
jgi:hypothetical protein